MKIKKIIVAFGAVLLILGFASCKKDSNDADILKLQVSSFYPNSGKGSALVTFIGQGFDKNYQGNKVTFNGEIAEVLSVTDSSLVVSVPEKGTTGKVSISSGGTSLDVGTFTYQNLSLSSVYPLRATAFDVITIKGYGFRGNASMPVVKINQTEAKITFVSDSTLQVSVPQELKTNGQIKLFVGDKQVSGPELTIVKVNDYFPKAAFGGSEITILGNGLNPTQEGNRVYYKSFRTRLGQRIYYTDTLKIVQANTEKLVAVLPKTVVVKTGTIEIESDGITKVLKSTETPTFNFLLPPVIDQYFDIGNYIYVYGSGFSTLLEGLSTHVYIGTRELDKTTYDFDDSQFVFEKKRIGTGSGNLRIVANGITVEGPFLNIN